LNVRFYCMEVHTAKATSSDCRQKIINWMWGFIVWRYILPRLPLFSDYNQKR
jgi:hypothetical protein